MLTQIFQQDNVLEATKKRIEYVFNEFDNYVVSISGGKDSLVLFHLVMQEAIKRDKKVNVFFLDEEVIYNSTYEMIKYLYDMYPDNTIKHWYQIPFNLTNATSMEDRYLTCWEVGKSSEWMRRKEKDSVYTVPWEKPRIKNKNIGLDFYDVLYNFENSFEKTAFFIGLRAQESLNRRRAVIKNPGYKDVFWSTKRTNENINFYPLFDWWHHDIWKYIYDQDLKYSKLYDFQFKKGMSFIEMRTSSLIHEKSFKCLVELPEFEPKTYNKLNKRIKGISFAQETAKKKSGGFNMNKLPKNFKTWLEFRNHLLDTYLYPDKVDLFKKRFDKHLKNEYVYRQQCRQLYYNDYENNLPVDNKEDPRVEMIKKWEAIL